MSAPRFQPGAAVTSLLELLSLIGFKRWVYINHKPLHPAWVRNLSVASLESYIRQGSIRVAEEVPRPPSLTGLKPCRRCAHRVSCPIALEVASFAGDARSFFLDFEPPGGGDGGLRFRELDFLCPVRLAGLELGRSVVASVREDLLEDDNVVSRQVQVPAVVVQHPGSGTRYPGKVRVWFREPLSNRYHTLWLWPDLLTWDPVSALEWVCPECQKPESVARPAIEDRNRFTSPWSCWNPRCFDWPRPSHHQRVLGPARDAEAVFLQALHVDQDVQLADRQGLDTVELREARSLLLELHQRLAGGSPDPNDFLDAAIEEEEIPF
jgi:hypothetical protein